MMPYSPLEVTDIAGGIRRIHLQVFRALLAACVILVSCLSYSSTLKKGGTCPCETSLIFYKLHDFISQKIELFINTAVRTSNPTEHKDDFRFIVHFLAAWYSKLRAGTNFHIVTRMSNYRRGFDC
jgi:hypothetical protein